MTAPLSGARERLAEVLPDSLGPVSLRRPSPPLIPNGRPEPRGYGDELLDALLPVVESLADERAAEALEQAVQRAYDLNEGSVFGTAAEVVADMTDRAASLRAASRGETRR